MKRSIPIVCALWFAILLGTLALRAGDLPKDPFGDVKPATKPAAEKKKTKLPQTPVRHTGTEAIEAALAQRIPCEFVETPLKDVVEYIKDVAKIEIWLDEPGLKEEGVAPDVAVTCDLRDCRLDNVLHILLDKLHLAFAIHNDVLWITSSEKAFIETCTYDVADLVIYKDEKDVPIDDYEPLIDVITDVSPYAWDHNGGKGSIRGATLGTAKILLISQTHEVHKDIATLLAQIRAIAAKKSGGEGIPRRVSPRQRGDDDKQPSPRATGQSS